MFLKEGIFNQLSNLLVVIIFQKILNRMWGVIFLQLEQLEYIVTVMEFRSFSKAGQALHVSQSAISQSITKLENELGVKIFERFHNGVQPTEEGKELVLTASEVLSKLNELKEQAESYRNSTKNHIYIGIVTGLYLPFLPKLLSKLKMEFPQQEITLVERSSIKITEAIIQHEIDLGILVIYEKTLKYKNLISFNKITNINFYVLVDPHSPLAHYTSVKPEDINDQTFVMFNGEYMNWFFDAFNQQYGPFKLLFTSNNNENISEAVRNGLAIAIETESEVRSNAFIKNGEIIAIPLIEHVNTNNFLGLVKLKNRPYSKEHQKSMKYIEQEITTGDRFSPIEARSK